MSRSRRLIYIITVVCLPFIICAREVVPFNDGWEFKKGPFKTDPMQCAEKWNSTWEPVTIPHTWNSEDMQKQVANFYQGPAYYRKTILFPKSLEFKRIFLRFEGVGSCAEVYINGSLVGSHRGAFSAFVCEIGPQIKFGHENEIVVKADNTARPDIIPINHVLFGVYGGIYRPVWLITTDACNITLRDCASSGVYITQENVSSYSAEVEVKVNLDNGSCTPMDVEVENCIFDRDGKLVDKQRQEMTISPQGIQQQMSHFKITKPHLWQGRDNPYLYKVVSRIYNKGSIIDEVIQPLGLRKIDIVAGDGFYLNGKKYPMYGVTRHQDWWELGSALSNKEHDFDLEQIMDIGATTVRFAHYQQSEYLYSRCDSLGLIIWAEIPFVNQVSGQEWDNAHQQMRELIRQNYNHPSIYVWGIHNEVYHPYGYTVALTSSIHSLCKMEDPNRFTVSVNGFGHVDHPVNHNADIQGVNRYYGWYEGKLQDMVTWVEGLERDYPWQKLILSEYGADANLAHQTELLGDALNWCSPFYPETFQTKTHEYHWSVIKNHPYIIASYLWNMFDFATPNTNRGSLPARNMKGLITFDRKTKKDSFFWYKANWSTEPVLYITQRRNIIRELKNTTITVYSNIGIPKIILNGNELCGIRKGYTEVHYILDNVELELGMNIVKAIVEVDGKMYQDQIQWEYNGDCNREADFKEHQFPHGSF